MNCNSFLPTNCKNSLIGTLLFRSYKTYANYSILRNEVKYLKTGWKKNLFALFFIDICIKKCLDKLFITHISFNTIR